MLKGDAPHSHHSFVYSPRRWPFQKPVRGDRLQSKGSAKIPYLLLNCHKRDFVWTSYRGLYQTIKKFGDKKALVCAEC